jgi:dephospho-CoA kinase
MIAVALTGGIGSGKSEVERLLTGHGAVVVDADQLAREVVEPGTPGLAEVVDVFGPQMLAADGSMDRPAMAAVVFADRAALRRLEAVIHPRVAQRLAELRAEAAPGTVLVYSSPLLAEGGPVPPEDFDLVVVVDTDDAVRVDRVVRQRGMSEADARARMAAQATREQRLAIADVVVDNSGSREELADQVDRLWDRIRTEAAAAG